jgi:hypothetical protein
MPTLFGFSELSVIDIADETNKVDSEYTSSLYESSFSVCREKTGSRGFNTKITSNATAPIITDIGIIRKYKQDFFNENSKRKVLEISMGL